MDYKKKLTQQLKLNLRKKQKEEQELAEYTKKYLSSSKLA
jgi:hypothetical protein